MNHNEEESPMTVSSNNYSALAVLAGKDGVPGHHDIANQINTEESRASQPEQEQNNNHAASDRASVKSKSLTDARELDEGRGERQIVTSSLHNATSVESMKLDVANEIEYNNLEVSRELTPPPLPPRPSRMQSVAVRNVSPPNSSRTLNSSPRPKLQSKATTALSLADIATPLRSSVTVHSALRGGRAALGVRNMAQYTRCASMGGSETEDSGSIQSFVPGVGMGGDMESLHGGFGTESIHEGSSTRNTEEQSQEHGIFDDMMQDDSEIDHYFQHEFDDLEDLASDGSNEESLMVRWKLKLKHFMILSSAGKPIYSRHGDDQLISNSIGVIQTILSIFIGADDSLQSFTAGDSRFVIVSKGHLHLVAISRLGENDAQLRVQLEALYTQILSTLTLPTMQRMFLNRPSTDLRRPLEGTETLLSSLSDGFTRGSPSTLLSALECLRIRKSHREAINRSLTKCKSPSLLYGLVVAGGRLVSVIRPRKHSLHPGDLHLIFNMLFEADGIRAGGGESWIPLCLPGFNNTGYLYMYVSFLRASAQEATTDEEPGSLMGKEDEIAIILISPNKEGFFELRKMRDELVDEMRNNGSMSAVRSAVKRGRRACTDIAPGTVVRHFLYKSRANVQFTMPALEAQFNSGLAWRKLMSLYALLHSAVHGKNAHLKVYTTASKSHISLAWVTPLFELYCVAAGSASRSALAQGANKMVQWAQSEEQRLFVIGGAVSETGFVF